jgi:CrcB protein
MDNNLKLSITTGFFGAFTTFSTMCKDTYLLIELGKYCILFLNLLISILLGLISAYSGIYIADKFSN